ncbi:oxidoreductase [Pseudomassariella vexata]|uniref:Oxidoreductase n=1 Tax=Pseudomassariella vexata TaxID=1141098 RepID=A0A1Y2E8D2_9PEZI|nr:oxidoreductase [Pseudomassariella vexata]ORY67810.1 oxidoreductase [Pseudomassariella vexata]
MAQQHEEKDVTFATLPAILCLHGYGTNAAIFRCQLRQITQTLSRTFRFVFVEGPFHVQQPGPGALPAFADARPFRRWHSHKTLAGAFGVSTQNVEEERRQVRDLLKDTLEREREHGPGVVGVAAFSQGAGVAASLCLDSELGTDIKFAVIICALYPAVSLAEHEDGTAASKSTMRLIEIPSIHIQGMSDSWKGQGTKVLREYFNGAKAKIFNLVGVGHEVPSRVKEAAIVADEVMAVWKSILAGGQE